MTSQYHKNSRYFSWEQHSNCQKYLAGNSTRFSFALTKFERQPIEIFYVLVVLLAVLCRVLVPLHHNQSLIAVLCPQCHIKLTITTN